MDKTKIIIGILAALLVGSLAFIGITHFTGNKEETTSSSEQEPTTSELLAERAAELQKADNSVSEWESHIAHADNLVGLNDTDKANLWVTASKWLDNNGYTSKTTVLDCSEPSTIAEAHEGVEAIVAKLDIVGREKEAILAQYEGGVWAVSKWLDPDEPVEPEPEPVEESKEEKKEDNASKNQAPAQPTQQEQAALAQQDQHGEFHSTETQFDVHSAWPLTKADKVDAVIGQEIRERLLDDLNEQFSTIGIEIKRPDDVMVSEKDTSTNGSVLYFRICVLSNNDRIVTDCAYDTETLDHEYQILP